jgi:hypothetical protein
MRAKMKCICKKFIIHETKKCLLIFAISLSSCSRSNANFKLDQSQCSLFMTVRHIFEISEDDHPRLVTHARDIWWTSNFANAFASPGINSRVELVPSHGASRRLLGDEVVETLYWVAIKFWLKRKNTYYKILIGIGGGMRGSLSTCMNNT